MISRAEIAAGVAGAWRLARRDPGGLAYLNATPDGFWKSFWAAALVLPGHLALQGMAGSFESDFFRALAVELITYVISWVAFPLAMVYLAEGLERQHRYWRFLVAYNWSAVIQMTLFLPVGILAQVLPGSGMDLLAAMLSVVLLVYQAYIAHVALEVKPGTAAAIIFFDLMLGLVIRLAGDALLAA